MSYFSLTVEFITHKKISNYAKNPSPYLLIYVFQVIYLGCLTAFYPCLNDDLVLAELLEAAQLEGMPGAGPVVAVNLVELVRHILAAQTGAVHY